MKIFDRVTNWVNRPKIDTPEVTVNEDTFLARYRSWAFWALAVVVVVATVAGQTESFNGLYNWFANHGITGFWADFAPLMVDSFTVIGELAIFVALTGHWVWKKRFLPWSSVVLGLAASVAGNVGDKAGHPVSWQLTAMIPPLAGALGIMIGFSVLKSLAKEVADKEYRKNLVKVTAEIVEDIPVLPEVTVEVPVVEAPKLKGLDALIPPRASELPPATVPVAEDGANTVTEWRGLPDGAQRLRRADLQTTVRSTGQFPAVQ
jgi:hypothetical protein